MDGRGNRISPFSVVLIMVALSLVGIASLPRLNIQYTPAAVSRGVSVSFSYRNASAEIVEAEVTSKIEGVLAGIRNVTDISSESGKGSGRVYVKFRKGTDMDAARFEVASAIRNVYPSLPDGVSYPGISRSGGGRTSRISYLVKGGIPSREISEYVKENVVSHLVAIRGVDKVNIYGGVPFQWVITFDAAKVQSLGVTADEIAAAFNNYYREDVIGMTESGEGMMTVRLKEASGEDFGALPIKKVGERVYHLRDVASWRYEEALPSYYYRVNGLNTVTLSVEVASTANLLTVASAVRERMEELQEGFPAEITASLAYDSSEYVSAELHKIYVRTALCILILLLFVFLINRSWRYMLIIVFTLTVNVLSALMLSSFAGLQIHIYTLAGITVSLGIIIDTSIVMIDHYAHFKDRKVFPSILSAAATTVGALMMVLLLPEKEKANLVDFIWVIVINLGLSLLISYLFIPSLMEYIPVKASGDGSSRSPRKVRRILRWNRFYASYIGWGMRHRWVYVLVFIAAFGIPLCVLPTRLSDTERAKAGWFDRFVDKIVTWEPYERGRVLIDKIASSSFGLFYRSLDRSDFCREPEKQRLHIAAGMLEGCTVGQLNEVVKEMENYLSKFDEISVFTTSVYSYDNAEISVEFKPEYENSSFPAVLKSEVTRMAINFGGANWKVSGIDDNNFNNNIVSSGKSNRISLKGYNYQELTRYAGILLDYLSANRRVREAEVWSGGWSGRPSMEFVLDYDFARMTLSGINPYSYYNALGSLLYEREIGTSEYDGVAADVVLRSSDLDRYDLWHVLNSPIEVGGRKMTLSSVGGIDKRRTGLTIRKSNQSYELVVCYDFIGDWEQSRSLSGKAVKYMNDEILPIGYKAEVPQRGWFDTAKKQYAWLLFLILAVMYVMLAMTFESFRYPFAVIFMVPVSFIGIFLAFGLSDFLFDQGGFAAFVMLSGIVVNAGIYLVTTYQSLLKERQGLRTVARSLAEPSARSVAEPVEAPFSESFSAPAKAPHLDRIRLYVKAYSRKITPITLTIISTILGLLPFLTDGPEEVFWFDFAVGTISGMLFSIIAVIFILPVFCINAKDR